MKYQKTKHLMPVCLMSGLCRMDTLSTVTTSSGERDVDRAKSKMAKNKRYFNKSHQKEMQDMALVSKSCDIIIARSPGDAGIVDLANDCYMVGSLHTDLYVGGPPRPSTASLLIQQEVHNEAFFPEDKKHNLTIHLS
ncbi:hypothetical protein E2C01_041812 [Portunus trituberculatus]|uniref:Uncharacterized protein n=1 Tax=Portunus trituberculatus TaxID=210409 RepID=A0A5B7FRP8_PORTR|nr:hypothetical protein [Portunus trituberculatus]